MLNSNAVNSSLLQLSGNGIFAAVRSDLPVWSDPERPGGRVCFAGTRVPVDALFENLEAGLSLEEFLDEFKGVTREQAVADLAGRIPTPRRDQRHRPSYAGCRSDESIHE